MKYAKALEAGSVSFFSLILSTARSESKVIRWLGRLFRNRAIEHRLDAELEFHVEQQTADYIAAGMNSNRGASQDSDRIRRIRWRCC